MAKPKTRGSYQQKMGERQQNNVLNGRAAAKRAQEIMNGRKAATQGTASTAGHSITASNTGITASQPPVTRTQTTSSLPEKEISANNAGTQDIEKQQQLSEAGTANELTDTTVQTATETTGIATAEKPLDVDALTEEDLRGKSLDVLPMDQQQAINEKLENIARKNNEALKTAQVGRQENANDENREEGEKFARGDVIDYLYDQLLKNAGKAWDKFDQWAPGAIATLVAGPINATRKAYNEDAGKRDYRDMLFFTKEITENKIASYKKTLDEETNKAKDAFAISRVLANAGSLEEIEAAYEEHKKKGAKDFSQDGIIKDGRDMKSRQSAIYEALIPPKEDENGNTLTPQQRNQKFQENLARFNETMQAVYGEGLSAAITPTKGEPKADFLKRSAELVNAYIDHNYQQYDIRSKIASQAALETAVLYAPYIGQFSNVNDKYKKIAELHNLAEAGLRDKVVGQIGEFRGKQYSNIQMSVFNEFMEDRRTAATRIIEANTAELITEKTLDKRLETSKEEARELLNMDVKGYQGEGNGGKEQSFFSNGNVRAENLPDGTARTFYENGTMRSETLRDGTSRTFYENGKQRSENLPDGTSRTWYDTGQLRSKTNPDGTYQSWYVNGNIRRETFLDKSYNVGFFDGSGYNYDPKTDTTINWDAPDKVKENQTTGKQGLDTAAEDLCSQTRAEGEYLRIGEKLNSFESEKNKIDERRENAKDRASKILGYVLPTMKRTNKFIKSMSNNGKEI